METIKKGRVRDLYRVSLRINNLYFKRPIVKQLGLGSL